MLDFQDYKPFEEPIEFKGFNAVGYFPYEKATINLKVPRVPRNVFSHIENVLANTPYMDNKIVVVFKDTTRFNTRDFCISFQDSMCKMGKLDQIIGYGGQGLHMKPAAKIYNGTSHAINIYKDCEYIEASRRYIKSINGQLVRTIPANVLMLNARMKLTDLGAVDGIPRTGKTFKFKDVDPLPPGYDIYIVSALYATAAKQMGMDMSQIYTVSDPVYNDDGHLIGCLGICKMD